MEPDFQNRGYEGDEWSRRRWERRQMRWERRQRNRHSNTMVSAMVLIAIGAIFLLNNLHIITFHDIWQYWPVILIAIGMVKVVDATDNANRTGGAILIVLGAIFLAPTLGIWNVSIGDLWPLILIGIGGVLLFQRLWMPQFDSGGRVDASVAAVSGSLNESAIFSGGKRRFVNPDFRGGEISCIFGGFDIDLRKAGMASDSAVMVVNAIFGGCDIKVPENWDVVLEIAAVFGGCDDKTTHPDPSLPGVKKLYLRGSAIFGGIDVKN